jgi:flagellar hook-length control protein FliK
LSNTRFEQFIVSQSNAPAIPELAMAITGAEEKREAAPRERWTSKTAEAGATSSSFGSSTPATAALGLSTSSPTPPTDVVAAEQVAYWVAHGVQNAELQLDGLGDKPVEVTISMQGNEAHVSFRTDELNTLSVLEGAGAQLKDMLNQQGLVLSGVSVGAKGSGESGAQERKSRQNARQVEILAVAAAESGTRRATSSVTGRSVDLFV